MSVRLNVLIVQSSHGTDLQAGIAAELVVRLIGMPGIDVALVTSLDPTQMSQTDRLLVESFTQDVAVIDWRDRDDTMEKLRELGLAGRRSPHRLDPEVSPPTAGTRRFYLVDLRRGDSPDAVVEMLAELLRGRRVVTIPLGLAKPAPPAGKPIDGAGDVPGEPRTDALSPAPLNKPPAGSASQDEAVSQARSPKSTDSDLDALVDDLNDGNW